MCPPIGFRQSIANDHAILDVWALRVAVFMPKVGTDTTDGRIAAWLKRPGDPVERGEDLLEVETEKATVSVQATHTGTLSEIVHTAGDEVTGGKTIGYIETE